MRKTIKLAALSLAAALFAGCTRQEPGVAMQKPLPTEAPETVPVFTEGSFYSGSELMCEAASEAEALEIAGLYGIELIRFRNGIALFRTEEDPEAVIERGREQGWPELARNGLSTIF